MTTRCWRTTKLIEIAAKKRWALNGGPFGSKLTTKHYSESGVPVIRGINLSGGARFSFENFVWVSEEKADELLPNNAHPGDLVFTQRGTIGQVGLIPLDAPFKRFIISQSQMKLSPDPEQADALFLYYYFSLPDTVKAIENLAFSSGVPHINLEILRNFEVPLPPLPLQRRNRRHPIDLRRLDREQSAAHTNFGGDGPRPLPRVVRSLPLPRPRKPPARRLSARRHSRRLGGNQLACGHNEDRKWCNASWRKRILQD
jgi:hypothetical protein